MKRVRLLSFISLLLITACESQKQADTDEAISSPPRVQTPDIRPATETMVIIPSQPSQEERLIADTLFEGLQALDQDKLLTPVDDNAYSRFQRVLAIDPANKIALEGVEQILLRYVELSAEASRRGQFSDAESFLEKAAFVDAVHHPKVQPVSFAFLEEVDGVEVVQKLLEEHGVRFQELAAIMEISTRAPLGRAWTATASRAG